MYVCETCNREFETYQSLGGHRRQHNDNRFRKSFEDCKDDRSRKRSLLRERGQRCEVCQNTEWMGKSIPIEIDHIDGNPENTAKENYRLICPNCHAQTETYKGRNIGKVKNSKRAGVLKKHYGKYR